MSTNVLSRNWRTFAIASWVVAGASFAIGLAVSIGGLYSLVPLYFFVLGFWLYQKAGA